MDVFLEFDHILESLPLCDRYTVSCVRDIISYPKNFFSYFSISVWEPHLCENMISTAVRVYQNEVN